MSAIHEAAYTPPSPREVLGRAPGFSLEDGVPELLLPLVANLLATWLAWCVIWLLWRRPRGTRSRAAFALGLDVAVFVFTSVPSPLSPLTSRPAYATFPGTVVYPQADVLGSSVLTTDQTGAGVQSASCKPFGDAAPAAGGGSSPVPRVRAHGPALRCRRQDLRLRRALVRPGAGTVPAGGHVRRSFKPSGPKPLCLREEQPPNASRTRVSA